MSSADQTFTITLDGTTYQVEMHGNTVMVDGQPFVVGFEAGGVSVDGSRYEVSLEGDQAIVNGVSHSLALKGLLAGPQMARSLPPATAPVVEVAEGAGVIKAIMPGKVIRVLVADGDEIQEGDVALILEAMKMENEVTPGEDVELGQLLVLIE